MGFWSKKEDKKLDQEMERTLTDLFKKLDTEEDPDRKKELMEEIRMIQEKYKETKKNKHKWWFMK